MKLPIALFTLLILLSFAGAGAVVHAETIRASSTTPTWTFMVYLDADNSLSPYAADNLASMMSYGSNANLHIVVLYDSTQDGDSALYLIEKGKKELLESLGEVDMGSEKTLQFFLNWTAANYPAQHYFLDLWDHGSYYHGVCMDHGDWLTLNEINEALRFFDEKIGHKLDVIGFDACRMGGIEIYYSLAPYAQYAVASEKDEPASGWPYYDVLSGIYGKSPEQAARATADAMYNWAKKFYAQNGLSVTMAAVNLTRIPEFVHNFNEALKEAMPVVPYYAPQLKEAFQRAERYELSSVADLYNLMEKIREIHDYKLDHLAYVTMNGILNTTYSRAWDCPNPANGVHAKHAHGMGIYTPRFFISGDYYSTAFAQATLWPEFLNYVLSPPPLNGTGQASMVLHNGTIYVNYTTSASYVEIFVENSTPPGSGVLPAAGNYTVNVGYGTYSVYLYAYNSSGMVIWIYRTVLNYMKIIVLNGKFYLDGHILSGAIVNLKIGNRTFSTVQNSTGFRLKLLYPSEIRSNVTIRMNIRYGMFIWHYTYHLENMRGNSTLPVVIRAYMFPSVLMDMCMAIFAAIISAYFISSWKKINQ
ncbi:MAG: hypothetical protein GXO25_03180 [Euryarchaeota archaeon]|nr:hypothetical protein [Euryarchaeota archaeon]